jgi:hypothetical protein
VSLSASLRKAIERLAIPQRNPIWLSVHSTRKNQTETQATANRVRLSWHVRLQASENHDGP